MYVQLQCANSWWAYFQLHSLQLFPLFVIRRWHSHLHTRFKLFLAQLLAIQVEEKSLLSIYPFQVFPWPWHSWKEVMFLMGLKDSTKIWYPKVLMFSTSTKIIKFLNYWSLKQILGEKKQISLFPSDCTFRSIAVLWPEKYPKVGGWEVLLKLVFTTQEFPKYQGKITPLRINPSRKKLTFFQTSKPVPSWEQKVWFHLQRRFTNQEYHWKKTPVTIYPSSFWGIH